jgi:hypothetical protein
MNRTLGVTKLLGATAGGFALLAAGYAAVVGTSWWRYGRSSLRRHETDDALLDRFMPEYEVAERHWVRVAAPAAMTLAAAADIDLQQSRIVRAIFRARELALGAAADGRPRSKGLLADMTSLGWRVLAETPEREIVVGAVTQPWLPNVVFRGLSADEFRQFQEPDYVKIVWTLRADPVGDFASIFRTETRVATTDPSARAKFRWYWARFSPGIILIRYLMLGPLRREAERRALEVSCGENSARG